MQTLNLRKFHCGVLISPTPNDHSSDYVVFILKDTETLRKTTSQMNVKELNTWIPSQQVGMS